MAYLFEIKNRVVYPFPETLLISPFKEIWKRDRSEKKERALEEFAYIEFSTSMLKSNPYKGYPENIRGSKIVLDIMKKKDWKPDIKVKEGIKKVEEFQNEASPSLSYHKSVTKANEGLISFFQTVDLDERNEKTGNPLYKPKDITSAINDASRNTTELSMLAKKVEEELFDSVKTKAGKSISPFARKDSFK